MFYRFARSTLERLLRLLYRFRVIDEHYVPQTGPLLIASNHIHNFDPPVVGLGTTRFVHFMAKEELFRFAWFGRIIHHLGAFPIKRGAGDLGALRQAVTIPRSGGCLVVFPEGHRSKTGRLGKGRPGAAFIARRAGCPIVPAAVIGPYQLFKPLTVRFGPPIVPEAQDDNDTLTDRIMEQIALLVEKGHAEH